PDSRLIVLRGDSCTGRSRAVYEALADRLPGWPVRHPVTAAELAAGIPERTVLWLGDLRRHVDAEDGAALLGHLADLLDGEGHLVIATVWPQDWEAYTTAAGTGRSAGDPARTAGRLLSRLPEADEQTLESIEPGWGGWCPRTGRGRQGGGGRIPARRLPRPVRPPHPPGPGGLACAVGRPGRSRRRDRDRRPEPARAVGPEPRAVPACRRAVDVGG